jgi:hypothetical protein
MNSTYEQPLSKKSKNPVAMPPKDRRLKILHFLVYGTMEPIFTQTVVRSFTMLLFAVVVVFVCSCCCFLKGKLRTDYHQSQQQSKLINCCSLLLRTTKSLYSYLI